MTRRKKTTSATVIVLSQATNIPFDKLVLSQRNVRSVKDGVSIEQLAADIEFRTLLQSLNVRAVLNEDGSPSGAYEVPAGGRRFEALRLLVQQGKLEPNALIPCVVRTGGSATDDSLAENELRVPLHPLDQFRTFQALRLEGMTNEEIAARHFCTAEVVRQRLRLANVAEEILAEYQSGALTLDQVIAFAVTEDRDRQRQVWEALKQRTSYERQPHVIRRMLTETSVVSSDRRVTFVGLGAYVAAGGRVDRDLFSHSGNCWCIDVPLLDRLVLEKLSQASADLQAKGWKWVVAAPDLPYGVANGMRELTGARLSDDDEVRLEDLYEQKQALLDEVPDDEDLPPDVDTEVARLEEEITALEEKSISYSPDEMAIGGCFLSISRAGELVIERGYVRPEDEPAVDSDVTAIGVEGAGDEQCRTFDIAGETSEPAESDEEVERPLPSTLVAELAATRTVALRNAVAKQPEVAFNAVLLRLLASCFSRVGMGCMQVHVNEASFYAQPPDLARLTSSVEIRQRHDDWRARMPANDDDLWSWLCNQSLEDRMALFAHCVSYGVNDLNAAHHRHHTAAAHLATVVGLDMAAEWKPTPENYLGRVTKAHILRAVQEGVGEDMARRIEHMKKVPMAAEAARLLEPTRWLPQALRTGPEDDAEIDEAAGTADTEELPAFLMAGTAEDGEIEEAAPLGVESVAAIAAE